MTRIVGLLSWFDESPARLAACVTSMARVCDHIVAVDGRYEQYPDDRVRSGTAEYHAIVDAANAAGVGVTVESAQRPWRDEMEKRTHLFRVGLVHATPMQDWFFVLDADEVVAESAPREFITTQLDEARERGAACVRVCLWEKADPAETPEREKASASFPIDYRYEVAQGRFWLALHDMRVVGYHYNYVGENDEGVTIEAWGKDGAVENRPDHDDALRFHVTIENRNRMRSQVRDKTRAAYYQARDESQVEAVRPLAEYEAEEAYDGAAL